MPRTCTVLIVDDNTAAADSLARLIDAIGYRAIPRYSALDVLENIKEDAADLMLIDIGMPIMDGYELLQELRARDAASVPIVALTGYGLQEDKERARTAGFTMHLTKPIGLTELRSVLTLVDSSAQTPAQMGT